MRQFLESKIFNKTSNYLNTCLKDTISHHLPNYVDGYEEHLPAPNVDKLFQPCHLDTAKRFAPTATKEKKPSYSSIKGTG